MPKTKNNSLGTTFYSLTEGEAREWYQLKYINTTGYLLVIKRLFTKPDADFVIPNVIEFCKEWDISKSSFYRAVNTLCSDGKIKWEATEGIILKPETKVVSIPRTGLCPTNGTLSHERDSDSHERDCDSHERDCDSHERDEDINKERACDRSNTDLNTDLIQISPLTPQEGNRHEPSLTVEVVKEEEVEQTPPIKSQDNQPLLDKNQNPGIDKSSGRVATKQKNKGLTEQQRQWFLDAYNAERPKNFVAHKRLSPKHCIVLAGMVKEYGDRAIDIFAAALTWVREQKNDWWRKDAYALDNLMSNGKIHEYADKHFFAMETDPDYCSRVEGRSQSNDKGRSDVIAILDENGEQVTGATAECIQALANDEMLQLFMSVKSDAI